MVKVRGWVIFMRGGLYVYGEGFEGWGEGWIDKLGSIEFYVREVVKEGGIFFFRVGWDLVGF